MVAAIASDNPTATLPVNEKLFRAISTSVEDALSMGGLVASCVGTSSVPIPGNGTITGLIGVHGSASGFVTVNSSETLAMKVVGGLLQDDFSTLSAQIIDGFGELTNIIAGGIKARLSKSEFQFSKITVPSVIIGESYEIAYAKGLEFICVVFELNDPNAIMLDQRLLRVSMSLLRL
ncbi:hypothetical protein Pan258_47080 [Symmachiella dynata]|uniref:Chemotaxis phosphatase CheX-like domain-containing protein n=1 Tax=Symmachiella dynata TaxID=2527995 RepID=A0A517ZUW8_9PLAN|nr:chemotaxis protein CheX [Symmachiella dynata]QDT50629.1 hypothetical protein Pan258_47080 [Symmachiella dynata]QDU46284.1 hypothetical protein Mal52_48020 [Symmachiella dynata]